MDIYIYIYLGCHPSHWRTPSCFKMVKNHQPDIYHIISSIIMIYDISHHTPMKYPCDIFISERIFSPRTSTVGVGARVWPRAGNPEESRCRANFANDPAW
jgi:hypothetical protein